MNWKDINIKKGKELYQLDKDEFYKNNELEKLTQQLCIILDKDVEWVESLPLQDVFKYKQEMIFLSDLPKGDFEKSITIDDVEYEMIDLTRLSMGEFMDLDTYCKDVFGNLELIMAVLYRPKNEKYDGLLTVKRGEMFLTKMSYEMTTGTVSGSISILDSLTTLDLNSASINDLTISLANATLTLNSEINILTSLVNSTSTAASKALIQSNSAGTQRKLTLNPSATMDIGFTNFTDIDASSGRKIWVWKPTLSNTNNIFSVSYTSFQQVRSINVL